MTHTHSQHQGPARRPRRARRAARSGGRRTGKARPVPAGQAPKSRPALAGIVVGSRDRHGERIHEVLMAEPAFRIYRTDKGISPQFSDDRTVAEAQWKNYLEIGQDLATLNHLILQLAPPPRRMPAWAGGGAAGAGSHPPVRKVSNRLYYYEREIARGIAQALTGDTQGGRNTLSALAARMKTRLSNRGRVTYFGVSVLAAAVLVALGATLMPDALGLSFKEICLAAIMGSIGALLSTATGLKKLQIDAGAGSLINVLYGIQRMFVGVLGAVVVYIAVRGGLALEMVPGLGGEEASRAADAAGALPAMAPTDIYKLAFICILAGFSERMVPNLLDRDNGTQAKAEGAATGREADQ